MAALPDVETLGVGHLLRCHKGWLRIWGKYLLRTGNNSTVRDMFRSGRSVGANGRRISLGLMHANSWIWDGAKHHLRKYARPRALRHSITLMRITAWGRVLTGTRCALSARGKKADASNLCWLTKLRERSDVPDLLGLDGVQVVILALAQQSISSAYLALHQTTASNALVAGNWE